jgi:hypothetical protein
MSEQHASAAPAFTPPDGPASPDAVDAGAARPDTRPQGDDAAGRPANRLADRARPALKRQIDCSPGAASSPRSSPRHR